MCLAATITEMKLKITPEKEEEEDEEKFWKCLLLFNSELSPSTFQNADDQD
jgi:hypothetical protein